MSRLTDFFRKIFKKFYKLRPPFWVVGGEPKTPKTRKEMLKQRYGKDYKEQKRKGKS